MCLRSTAGRHHPGCVWRSTRVVDGRNEGARGWQELFHVLVTPEGTKKAGFTVKVFGKSPRLYDIEEANGVSELHVDDGHRTGKPKVVRQFLLNLDKHIELK